MSLQWYSSLSMDRVTMSDNTATTGGGLYVYAVTDELVLSDVTITDNTADGGAGGGIAVEWYPTLRLDRATITGNTATTSGGGVYFFGYGNLGITDSTLSDNHSTGEHGGALYFYAYTNEDHFLDISGSTFAGNTAYYNGGAIESLWVKDLTITCLLYTSPSPRDDR